jgi:hypothetical protein
MFVGQEPPHVVHQRYIAADEKDNVLLWQLSICNVQANGSSSGFTKLY